MSPPASRTILHADMDAFYASIEQRDNPELRGKPVIVGGTGRRGVVAAASYESRRFGVHSAMPTAVAKRKCPDGVFVAPRMDVYVEVSGQVRAVFSEFTPLIEPLSLDEAFLDVTGSEALFGDGETIARKIKDAVRAKTGLTISVGVASCKYVAKVASDFDKPDGLTVVPPGTEIEFLRGLPVTRLWGVGPKTEQRFHKLGLRKIGDVQRLSLAEAVRLLGENQGHHYWHLARGLDDREVEPEREAKSVSHEITFEQDLTSRERCHQVLLQLSEMVGRRLRKQDLHGQVIKLKLRDPDFTTYSRQQKLPDATSDDMVIYRTVVALFDKARQPMAPVRLLGVGVAALSTAVAPGTGQETDPGEIFGCRETTSPDPLLKALDQIRDRHGDDAIGHGGGDRIDPRTHG
ncbi:MAG: DNA polymerase IV [Planctomycetota bacterium]|jgi:DNA polymerase-4